jgi:hypothetical protein
MKLNLSENRSNRKKWSWTKKQEARASDILKVLDEFKAYLPMTLRQIYYQLLHYANAPHWKSKYKGKIKTVDVYAALGRVLKWLRIHERIDRDVVIDEHRIITAKMGYTDTEAFIEREIDNFGYGYSRCNAQKQQRHIEVWIEKAALLRLVEPVADEFCRRVVVCKGYGSVTFQTQFYKRAMEALSLDMIPTVLYFGDWDPSGENMIYAAMQTIHDELGLAGIEYYRMGVNPEHFGMIMKNPVPIKDTDSRAKSFIKRHGSTAYELDALHPEQLKTLVRNSIIEFTDMSVYDDNKEQEQNDRTFILNWREQVKNYALELSIV